MATGLLLVRLVFGALMTGHGLQKLFGWFGGYGLSGTAAFFEQLGFRPGRLFAGAAGFSEVLAGLLITLGFGGPIGPALMVSVMIVAAISVHWRHGVFAATNGIEVPLLYAASAASLAFTGPGQYSLDALLGLTSVWTTTDSWVALTLAAVMGTVNLAARHRVPSNAHA